MSLEAVLETVPELRNAESVAPLPGGLTNTNYKVEAGGRAYVVRIPGIATAAAADAMLQQARSSGATDARIVVE